MRSGCERRPACSAGGGGGGSGAAASSSGGVSGVGVGYAEVEQGVRAAEGDEEVGRGGGGEDVECVDMEAIDGVRGGMEEVLAVR